MSQVQHEEPLEPVYPFNPPGAPIVLHSGPVCGHWEGYRNGVIELKCQPGVEVRWQIQHEARDLSTIDRDVVTLGFERHGHQWNLDASQRSWEMTNDEITTDGWINSAKLERTDAQLKRVLVHWMNLPRIDGPIGLQYPDGLRRSSGRWRVEVDGWSITLDSRRDYRKAMKSSMREDLYLLTHVMEIRRMDGDEFTASAVERLIECLRVTLSFASGHWVAPVLPVGFDRAGEVAWERWSSPICDRARSIGTAWLYGGHHDDISDLITCAVPAFNDHKRPEITRYQMILAIQAVESGFLEQRILAAVPALEHLAWEQLVLKGKMTSKEYEDRFAEDRLRYLLQRARIPTGIDSHLPALVDYARTHGKLDGPSAITRVRNRLIHPKTPEDQIYRHDGLVLDTWRLTLHYVTLLILHSIGYQGSYQNPTQKGWAGDSIPVPWAGNGDFPAALPPSKAVARRSSRAGRSTRGRNRHRGSS
ncbi:hypothetical protein [Streptomyces sp. bgisy034]|uniref:hypothetical protein n=1 Tax=Streptomyces sp. bgisy034 TaxID=3413774 RepID=UPI003EBBA636